LTQIYSGYSRTSNNVKAGLVNSKKSFKLVTYGNSHKIVYSNSTYAFFNRSNNKEIPIACKQVLSCAKNYLKKYSRDTLSNNPNATTMFSNRHLLKQALQDQSTEIVAIDIKACYWNILKNKGILTKKVYNKYLDNKLVRLVAVGNLAKAKHERFYINGKENKDLYIRTENKYRIIWDYVVSQVWDVFHKINYALSFNIMFFKTDCFYVLPEYEGAITNYLRSINLNYSIEYLTCLVYENNILTGLSSKTNERKQIFHGFLDI
jgi:hypothetical protein